jgi:hypothetical protein
MRHRFTFLATAAMVALVGMAIPSAAEGRVDVEAIPGRPFGVGRITLSGADLAITPIGS